MQCKRSHSDLPRPARKSAWTAQFSGNAAGRRRLSGASPCQTARSRNGDERAILKTVSRRLVLALVLIGALWQGPAAAYLDATRMAAPLKPDVPVCSGVASIDSQTCNDCCGGGCDPGCQSACGFSGAAAISTGTHQASFFAAALSQPIALGRTAIVCFDTAPPIRPPIR